MVTKLEHPQILIVDKIIDDIEEMVPILEPVIENGKPFLIIAEDIISDALVFLMVKKARKSLQVAALKTSGSENCRKAMLEDIAVLTNGTVISRDQGIALRNVTIDMLGRAEKAYVYKDSTIIVSGSGDKTKIEKQVNEIKEQIKISTNTYDKEELMVRLNKLNGKAAFTNWQLFSRLR